MVKNPWKIGKIPMDFSINFHQLAITLDRGLATFWSWTQSWTSDMDDMGKNDSIPLDMLDGYGWFDMENPMENPKNSKWMRTGGSPMTIMTQEASKCNIMQECSTSSKHIWRSEMTIILVLFHAWNGQSECMFSTNINIESTSNLISGTSRRIWFPQSPLRSILRLASTGSLGLSNSLSLIVTWCCSTCISVCWCLLIFLGFANRKACPREAGYVNVTCQRDVFFFQRLGSGVSPVADSIHFHPSGKHRFQLQMAPPWLCGPRRVGGCGATAHLWNCLDVPIEIWMFNMFIPPWPIQNHQSVRGQSQGIVWHRPARPWALELLASQAPTANRDSARRLVERNVGGWNANPLAIKDGSWTSTINGWKRKWSSKWEKKTSWRLTYLTDRSSVGKSIGKSHGKIQPVQVCCRDNKSQDQLSAGRVCGSAVLSSIRFSRTSSIYNSANAAAGWCLPQAVAWPMSDLSVLYSS